MRLQQADSLIQRKATGNAMSFAKKLNLSRSMLYEFLDEMKKLGCPVKYSRQEKTFYYTEPVKLTLDLFVKEMDKRELKKITGGKNLKVLHLSDYIGQTDNNFT
ncbi:MAG TPA: bacteriocin [Chitinophagaceae bacterium]|nr:bacteriocin [Chitinophagaceae bacterium]